MKSLCALVSSLIAIMLILLIGCSNTPNTPTPTAQPSPTLQTVEITATPSTIIATVQPASTASPSIAALSTATETPAPTLTGIPSTQTFQLFVDNFSSPCNLPEQETLSLVTKCEGESYTILMKESNQSDWTWYKAEPQDNLVIEVDAAVIAGTTQVSYGIATHGGTLSSDPTFFDVMSSGQYALYRYSNSKFIPLLAPTAAVAIRPGSAINHLKTVVQGNQLALYVNDQWLNTVTDASFSIGKFGVFAATQDPGGKVAFTNLRVSKINRPLALPAAQATVMAQPAAIQTLTLAVPRLTVAVPTLTLAVPRLTVAVPTLPTSKSTAVPTAPVPPVVAKYPLPADKGGLIVQNFYGNENTFTIANVQYKIPGNGEVFILLDPGKYPWSAFIPGTGQAHGTSVIQEGRLTRLPFADR